MMNMLSISKARANVILFHFVLAPKNDDKKLFLTSFFFAFFEGFCFDSGFGISLTSPFFMA